MQSTHVAAALIPLHEIISRCLWLQEFNPYAGNAELPSVHWTPKALSTYTGSDKKQFKFTEATSLTLETQPSEIDAGNSGDVAHTITLIAQGERKIRFEAVYRGANTYRAEALHLSTEAVIDYIEVKTMRAYPSPGSLSR